MLSGLEYRAISSRLGSNPKRYRSTPRIPKGTSDRYLGKGWSQFLFEKLQRDIQTDIPLGWILCKPALHCEFSDFEDFHSHVAQTNYPCDQSSKADTRSGIVHYHLDRRKSLRKRIPMCNSEPVEDSPYSVLQSSRDYLLSAVCSDTYARWPIYVDIVLDFLRQRESHHRDSSNRTSDLHSLERPHLSPTKICCDWVFCCTLSVCTT